MTQETQLDILEQSSTKTLIRHVTNAFTAMGWTFSVKKEKDNEYTMRMLQANNKGIVVYDMPSDAVVKNIYGVVQTFGIVLPA